MKSVNIQSSYQYGDHLLKAKLSWAVTMSKSIIHNVPKVVINKWLFFKKKKKRLPESSPSQVTDLVFH